MQIQVYTITIKQRVRLIKYSKGCLGNGETPAGERGRRDPGASVVSEEALNRKEKFD
ncbi:hypothetical protein GCM10011389_28040 [Pontibacillus salipaludis]|uniref:Uncharacterized protein n=1 Tax=Pontibacillus salipaludis TaxID=1697394 RepID=A0ABQ1Q967_9BACI|nr:hypothetical protein GCM10011389_28040 [Pontibacillus salipaludis]